MDLVSNWWIISLVIIPWVILFLGSFFESIIKKQISTCSWILLIVSLIFSQFLDVATTYIVLNVSDGLMEEGSWMLKPLVNEGNIYTLLTVKILILILAGFMIKFTTKGYKEILFIFGWILNIIFFSIGLYSLILIMHHLKII